LDGRVGGVLGDELDAVAAPAEALDRDLLVEACHQDLAVVRLGGAVHGQQIALEDTHLAHAVAGDAQQVVGPRVEQIGIDPVVPLDILLGQQRLAGGDPADQWQPGRRRLEQANPPRGTRRELDHLLAGERPQVGLGGIGRAEAEVPRDLGPRRRAAVDLQIVPDQVGDLALALGELGHGYLYFCTDGTAIIYSPRA
jgi:hypothetical protein